MLTAKEIVKASLDRARDTANTKRKKEAEKWIDIYEGRQAEHILPKEGESAAALHERKRKYWAMNVTNDIIWRTCRLYDRPPRRSLEGSNLPQECIDALAAAWGDPRTNELDANTERFTRLTGAVHQRVSWSDASGIKLQPFFSDSVDVKQLNDDPTEAEIVALRTRSGDDLVTVAYTSEQIVQFKEGWLIRWNDANSLENPYGIIPIVCYRDSYPWDDYWPEGWGRILTENNLLLNDTLTDLLTLVEYQSWSVPVFVNVPNAPRKQVIGPRSPLEIQSNMAGAGFKFETPSPDIPGCISVVNMHLDGLYQTHRLSQSPLRVTIDSSGVALAMRRIDLMDDIEARRRIWSGYERQRAWIMARVWCAHNGQPLPEMSDVQLSLRWAPPSTPYDPDARQRDDSFRLVNDLATRTQLLMERNPDLTEEQAVELGRRITAENAADRAARNTAAVNPMDAALAAFEAE